MRKHNHLILLFVVVSKCRLNVNSKLSINVTCNKARLKNLSSAFDDTNEHEIKRLYSPRVGGKIVCIVESRLIYRARKN